MNLSIVLSLLVVSLLAYRFRLHLHYAAHHLSYQPEWQIRRSLLRQVADSSRYQSMKYLADHCVWRVGLRPDFLEQRPKSYMEIVIDGPVLMVWFSEFVYGPSRIPKLKRIFEIDLESRRFRVVSRTPKPFRRQKSADDETRDWQPLDLFRAALNDVLGGLPAYFALTGEYLPESVEQPRLVIRKAPEPEEAQGHWA